MSEISKGDMSKGDMSKGKKRTAASAAILTTLFVVGAVVAVNLIGTRVFGRLDMTESKMYTISDSSRELVKGLPDYLNVKVFLSDDLPPELKSMGRYVRDLIDEYANSGDKFRWEAIDPGKDEKKRQEATNCKVEQLQIQEMRDEKFSVGAYYLGICLQYGDQIESIPQVGRPEGLEYAMSSLIKRMTQKKRKIAFTTGHGESEPNQGLQSLKEDLEKEYDVTTVNPSEAEIGADVDALIVAGPKQALDDKGQRAIDKFLMSGKGAVVLVDGMAMTSPGQNQMQMGAPQIEMGQPNQHGLDKVLESYGFKVTQDFIFEPEANAIGPVPVNGRMMVMNAPPFVAAATKTHEGLSVLAGLRGLVLPYASSLELVGPLKDGKPTQGKLWLLAESTPEAWRHKEFFVMNPTVPFTPSDEKGPFKFGYAFEGKLKSAFPDASAAPDPAAPKPTNESAKPVRLVVMSDSDFAHDKYVSLARHPLLGIYGNGAALLFNAISWTVEDEAMTPLRNKTMAARPLEELDDGKKTLLKWGNVLGLPLAFCGLGLVRWRIRRARRASMTL